MNIWKYKASEWASGERVDIWTWYWKVFRISKMEKSREVLQPEGTGWRAKTWRHEVVWYFRETASRVWFLEYKLGCGSSHGRAGWRDGQGSDRGSRRCWDQEHVLPSVSDAGVLGQVGRDTAMFPKTVPATEGHWRWARLRVWVVSVVLSGYSAQPS